VIEFAARRVAANICGLQPARPRGSKDQRRSTFSPNHAHRIVACDFFVSVTVGFRILYVFVALRESEEHAKNARSRSVCAGRHCGLDEAAPGADCFEVTISSHGVPVRVSTVCEKNRYDHNVRKLPGCLRDVRYMLRLVSLAILIIVTSSAAAATKDSGTTTLKDVQPVGTTDKKHKHQRYDLSFVSSTAKEYTCRTGEKTSVKATDLVVGSDVNYQVDGNKGKLKTSAGKQVSCTIVRVANVSSTTVL
jgi:hypothetical protein